MEKRLLFETICNDFALLKNEDGETVKVMKDEINKISISGFASRAIVLKEKHLTNRTRFMTGKCLTKPPSMWR